ncbi:DsbA family oxidoreductase [Sutcliffiella halmapala]|uniref:DsbA family oxidoreductase n=1 Tax=Sutcliffiella halmapala TaxID=79882 RepID=UPI001476543F|nr:DsbA family oxidoreductase [Sutcliffiella halmapala]
MKIEVWSDVMCPLCYIGKTNLETALEQFEHKAEVEIVYRPFQLFPYAPSNTGKNYYEWTAEIHGGGITADYVKEGNKSVIRMGHDIGLTYNLDTLIPSNTTDALRVAIYAQEQDRAGEWMAQVYKAYFTESLDIGDYDTLARLAGESGLDSKEVLNMLNGDKYKDTVRKERQNGSKIGISGTPFYILNDKYALSGVRSSNAFLEVLEQVWREEHPLQMLDSVSQDDSESGLCGDGTCKV